MSDSEYRGAREAARARVTALEAELRKKTSLVAKLTALAAPHEAEKQRLRKQVATIRKARIGAMVGTVLLLAGFPALMGAISRFDWGVGVVFVALVLMFAWVRTAWKLRFKSSEEREGERRLQEIRRQEERKDQRVASSQLRVQAHREAVDLEALERELDEARELAAVDEKKS